MHTQAPHIRTTFAKRLKALRIPRGFSTARSFANALEIDENRYTRYERAEVEPDLSLLVKMCSLLEVTPNDLLDASPTPGLTPGFSDGTAAPIMQMTSNGRAGNGNGHESVSGHANPHVLKNALAWRLAEEVVKLDSTADLNPIDKVGRVSKLFAEIEADPFSYVAGIASDPRLSAMDTPAAAQFAALAEALIASAKNAVLR
jgi:transcriptional regulator with XRE-family HTH domain